MSKRDKFTRRQILKTGVSLFSGFGLINPVHEVLNRDRHLIMIHLKGGNDALNTVVPFTDTKYYKLRSNLSIQPNSLRKINRSYGLHPALNQLSSLYKQGKLAIVLGTGYSDQSMSHVLSTNIWNTGDVDGIQSRYWFDNHLKSASHSRSNSITTKTFKHTDQNSLLKSLRRSSHLTSGTTSKNRSGNIGGELPIGKPLSELFPRLNSQTDLNFSGRFNVHHLELEGFDTHENQLIEQAEALRNLDRLVYSVGNLLDESNYLIYVYSEFGRSITPNEDGGTEHGSGGLTFVVGANVNGGIYGDYGTIGSGSQNSLVTTIDFRALHSSIFKHFIIC